MSIIIRTTINRARIMCCSLNKIQHCAKSCANEKLTSKIVKCKRFYTKRAINSTELNEVTTSEDLVHCTVLARNELVSLTEHLGESVTVLLKADCRLFVCSSLDCVVGFPFMEHWAFFPNIKPFCC